MSELQPEVKEILQAIQKNNQKRVELYDEWQELKAQLDQHQETVETPDEFPVQDLGQKTCGNFQDEISAENFFDNKLQNNPYFINEKQVRGRRLVDLKPVLGGSNGQYLRIDSILHPTSLAVQAGWQWGPIGVEIKKSNMAIGPVLSQVFEQQQTVFQSKYLNRTRIIPIIFAVFPMNGISHDLHSIQENQLILSCHYHSYCKELKFQTLSRNVLSIGQNNIDVSQNWKPSIRKGHRGRQK